MRAIDADALQLAIVEEGQANKRKKYIIGDIWELTGAEIREVINSQPTIQPAEPKKGKWIKTARWGRVYYCNQCRNYLDFDGVNAGRGSTNFCPNCGAKMEVTT